MRTIYSISCPQCRYRIEQSSGEIPLTYGDPRCICPHCGAEYINSWVVELAFMPKEWYEKNHRKGWLIFLLFVLSMAIPLMTLKIALNGAMWVGYVSVVLCIIGIGYSIYYKSKTTRISINDTGFEKKYEESEKRLSNQEYRQFLVDSGYYKKMMANIKT